MKKLLLILLCLPIVVLAQQTYVPDDNFEAYLEANGIGNGIANDDSVATSAIDTLTSLNISWQNISDLSGIENFITLVGLQCNGNQLTSLDLSQNIFLEWLECHNNQITSLDLSHNSVLYFFNIGDNPLTCLNIANGNSLNFNDCGLWNTPNLYCIEVDDSTNVVGINTPDPHTFYSNNCNNACSPSPTSIQEYTTKKELLEVIDFLGRETKQTNQPLFYIYDDGTVEKRITID